MQSEILSQARKYRLAAAELAPHLASIKADYIVKAELLENQALELSQPLELSEPASQIAVAAPPEASTTASSEPAPKPQIILSSQTKVHSNLAIAVLRDKRGAEIQRAFAMWLTMRRQSQFVFDRTEVIEFFADETGSHQRNVRRWLDAGEGLFWIKGRKNKISLRSKNNVFERYNLQSPGRVLLVDTSTLLGKLRTLRASLFALFTNGKDSKWISRETLSELTGVEPRTQLNYDYENEQHKQQTYALGYELETSESQAKQMPNRYYALWYPAYDKRDNQTKRQNLYVPETQQVIKGITEGGSRLLFDDTRGAVDVARRRAKLGRTGELFLVLPGPATKNGHLILKTVSYAAA